MNTFVCGHCPTSKNHSLRRKGILIQGVKDTLCSDPCEMNSLQNSFESKVERFIVLIEEAMLTSYESFFLLYKMLKSLKVSTGGPCGANILNWFSQVEVFKKV